MLKADRQRIGYKLVTIADGLHATRQYGELGEIAKLLVSPALSGELGATGLYYQALSEANVSRNIAKASKLFEATFSFAPEPYRSRAVLALAAIEWNERGLSSAMPFYTEAMSRATHRNKINDLHTVLGANRMLSFARNLEGDNRGALALLETYLPLADFARRIKPHLYYDTLNSIAVEKSILGKTEEALNISRVVVSSTYARAYPEWRETYDEIAAQLPTSSQVAIPAMLTKNAETAKKSSNKKRAGDVIDLAIETADGWRALKAGDLPTGERSIILIVKLRYAGDWHDICNDPVYGDIEKILSKLKTLLMQIALASSETRATVKVKIAHSLKTVFRGGITEKGIERLMRFLQRLTTNPESAG
jgi:hypothetical protein